MLLKIMQYYLFYLEIFIENRHEPGPWGTVVTKIGTEFIMYCDKTISNKQIHNKYNKCSGNRSEEHLIFSAVVISGHTYTHPPIHTHV